MSVRVVRVGRLGYGLLAVYGNLAVSDAWMVNVSDLPLFNIPPDEVGDRLVGGAEEVARKINESFPHGFCLGCLGKLHGGAVKNG